MSGFGTGALQLSALAARALGWRPDDFWSATPAELIAILLPAASAGAAVDRTDLSRMMEQDDGPIANK